jgi:glycosyltransferase involved in cell wall biosynthesis
MMSSSRLHILMTADAIGGVWTYVVTLCRGLVSAGCEVTLVTLGPRPSRPQRQALGDVEVIETDLALEWQDPAGLDRAHAERELGAIVDRIEPDVVHLNSFREATFLWPAPTLVVAHSCVSTWAGACGATCLVDTPPWSIYAAAVREGLNAATAWVAPTASFRDEIARHYGIDGGRVIWNGLDPVAAPGAKRPFVFSAGRLWDAAKNVKALIAAAPLVDWPVVLAGSIQAPDQVGDALESGTNVWLLGELPRADVLDWMQYAAVFASAARYEPFGLGALEAAQSGCALVLSDIASFRELWEGAALFVPNDIGALADALDLVCRDEDLRCSLQASALQRSRRYSATGMTAAYLALYREIAGRQVAPNAEIAQAASRREACA